jgi:hypothetical protein
MVHGEGGMNLRPYTQMLRRTFGRTSFIPMFDSTAGGGGRIVRLGMLFGVADGEPDSRRTAAVPGDRWVEIDVSDEAGAQRASHFLVTADCYVDVQGPSRMRASTRPTLFTSPEDMLDAIRHEVSRTDHAAPVSGRKWQA